MTERDMQGWAHELELERRYEYEQELLRADSAFNDWLDSLEQEHSNDERE